MFDGAVQEKLNVGHSYMLDLITNRCLGNEPMLLSRTNFLGSTKRAEEIIPASLWV